MKRLGLALAAAALVAGCKKKEGGAPPPPPLSDAAAAAQVPATPDAAPAAETVSFTVTPPAVGEIREITDVNHMTGTLKSGGAEVPLVQHHEESRTEEILAVAGPAVTKMKVTYGASMTHEKMGDEEKKGVDPLEGKTFVLSWEKEKLVVRDGAGKAVAADLAKQVQGGLSEEVGRETPMNKVLASRTFTTGQRVELTPEEMKALSPKGQDMAGKGVALTLLERKDDVATLRLEGGYTAAQAGMTTELTMNGTVKVQISTGRLVEMNIAGDIKGTGSAELTGTLSGTKVFLYSGGAK